MPWNQKSPSEQLGSMAPGKLNAHKDFGQGNKIQGSFKNVDSPTQGKMYGAPSIFYIRVNVS